MKLFNEIFQTTQRGMKIEFTAGLHNRDMIPEGLNVRVELVRDRTVYATLHVIPMHTVKRTQMELENLLAETIVSARNSVLEKQEEGRGYAKTL